MPPSKKALNLTVHQMSPKGRLFHINDLGEAHSSSSPRFELYDDTFNKPLKKSNNPLELYKYIEKE